MRCLLRTGYPILTGKMSPSFFLSKFAGCHPQNVIEHVHDISIHCMGFPKLWRCTPITGWFMYVYLKNCRNEVTNVTNGLKPGLLLCIYSWVPPWLRTPPHGSIVLMLRHGVAFAPRVGNWLAETKPVPQEALNLVG